MVLNPKALLRLITPAVLVGSLFWARPHFGMLSKEQLTLATYLPYALALLCVVLAYQFNQVRLMLLGLLTAISFYLIQTRLQASLTDADVRQYYAAVALAIPGCCLFLLLVPERGVINRYGLLYLLCICVLMISAPWQVSLLVQLLGDKPEWLQVWPREGVVLPLAIAVAYGVTAVAGLFCLVWRNTEAELALLSSLAAGALAMIAFHQPFISLAMFAVAGLVQLICILRSSHAMAYRDDLTGLLGRRALNERLQGLGARYSIAMLDVDHFKKFNDTHGHDVGDEVLKMVASRMAGVGGGGAAYRYGGEEFCIVFPRRDAPDCEEALEEVRQSIADYSMTLRNKGDRPQHSSDGARKRGKMATRVNSSNVSVTISIGLAQRSEKLDSPEEVLKAADKMLYKAKQAGRNKLRF